jgi:hypothetical protein
VFGPPKKFSNLLAQRNFGRKSAYSLKVILKEKTPYSPKVILKEKVLGPPKKFFYF